MMTYGIGAVQKTYRRIRAKHLRGMRGLHMPAVFLVVEGLKVVWVIDMDSVWVNSDDRAWVRSQWVRNELLIR